LGSPPDPGVQLGIPLTPPSRIGDFSEKGAILNSERGRGEKKSLGGSSKVWVKGFLPLPKRGQGKSPGRNFQLGRISQGAVSPAILIGMGKLAKTGGNLGKGRLRKGEVSSSKF
jgi:hypothetical protein